MHQPLLYCRALFFQTRRNQNGTMNRPYMHDLETRVASFESWDCQLCNDASLVYRRFDPFRLVQKKSKLVWGNKSQKYLETFSLYVGITYFNHQPPTEITEDFWRVLFLPDETKLKWCINQHWTRHENGVDSTTPLSSLCVMHEVDSLCHFDVVLSRKIKLHSNAFELN